MIKMNKLQGLASTYIDSASSENEFITAHRIACNMIKNEIKCEHWVASCVVTLLGNGDIWFPHPTREHLHGTRPTNAMELFKVALNKLNIKFSTIDYQTNGMGGTDFIKK